ncbi:peroxisomal 2,4-dienoyl-CoA reductase [Monoraphidium neglectum]|uniref:2,4-dienoyl-CoA reductase [(3E)-enoyl-CoA-producing] n=1 Tax=Monoraphidium neglectum TaxID=145388 RepID=A0A0D2MBM7_9CHLO|nr:peroxisomal 2,4-dienoyl-CoA reductase [Monoraphidium neglectum]KIZ00630.1 peroxisomal 2,4-dienoyl-CoA reductase [Monoraphidium neglectum]|eukprot:XP_013899649.1 peroxisomal 2,4-dienoyl-CoA reductase [Monoraphidium neglectum]
MAGLPPNPPLPGLHGASVVITGRRKDVLDGAVAALRGEGIAAAGLQGDVRQAAACADWVANTLAMYGGLDILVNCAAGNFLANAAELSQGGFKTVMEIDAVGTFTMSRAAFDALRAAGSSVIINISATLHYGATWYQVHASAAKAAVDSITRSLALEWGEYGVRVVGVAPGPIQGTAARRAGLTLGLARGCRSC